MRAYYVVLCTVVTRRTLKDRYPNVLLSRWFEKQGTQPLFPFGFGLSYTHFKYSLLKIANVDDGGLDVRFKIENVGTTASDEVPQLYVGPPSAPWQPSTGFILIQVR